MDVRGGDGVVSLDTGLSGTTVSLFPMMASMLKAEALVDNWTFLAEPLSEPGVLLGLGESISKTHVNLWNRDLYDIEHQ